MEKFKIQGSGKRSDGSFWIRIEKDVNGLFMKAFIKTSKEMKVGTDVELPASKVSWTY